MPRAIRNVKAAIQKVLAEHEKLTWLEIKSKTKLSKGALSKHLNELIDEGVVKTSTVKKKRKPSTTLYSLEAKPEKEIKVPASVRKLFRGPHAFENFAIANTASAFNTAYAISNLKNRELARNVIKGYFNTHFSWITSSFCSFIFIADAYARGREKGTKETRIGKLFWRDEKRYEFYLEKFKKLVHDFVDPWIEALAHAAFTNSDIALGTEGVVIDLGREISDVDVDWFNILERESNSPHS